jgi:WD40 repeat protein
LEPGEYCVYVEGELYFDTSAVVEVLGKASQVREIIKDYTLRPNPEAIRRKRTGEKYGGLIYAMSGSDDGKAKIWDLPSGNQILSLDNKLDVSSVAFSPYGKRAVSTTESGDINMWLLPDGMQEKTLSGHTGVVTQAEFSRNGKYLLTSSADSTIRLWNVGSGLMEKLYVGHLGTVNEISISPDGNYFVSCSDDGNVLMWEMMTEELVGVFEGHNGAVKSATYSPRGNYIITGGQDGTVRKWDGFTAEEQLRFDLHSSPITATAISPDGTTVVSGSQNGFIYVWDAETGEVKHVLLGHDNPISSLYISKDLKYIISGSNDKQPIVWDYFSGTEVTALAGHSSSINDVCFSPYIKFPEKETVSAQELYQKPDELEDEIARLEEELAAIEEQKEMGYDPTLLDVDVDNSKEFKVGQKIILERIYFDFDKYTIRDESVIELNKLLVFLQKNPGMVVEISGHTDSRGGDDYNLKLSQNRAKAVVQWLKKRKIPGKRMEPKGYGETQPIAPNANPDGSDNPEGRQMNRRIELTILGMSGEKVITTEGK